MCDDLCGTQAGAAVLRWVMVKRPFDNRPKLCVKLWEALQRTLDLEKTQIAGACEAKPA